MKRKAASILVTGLIVASLAGCGTKTEATEQKPENNASVVEAETETNTEDVSDETMSTEVIGEDTEEIGFTGAENDNIVLYAEIEEYGEYSVNIFDYVEQPGTVNATEDVPIYNEEGINVGYIKNGSSVFVSEGADVGGWARFENPIVGTDYEYLYVLKEFVTDPEEITLTAETMKQGIIDFVLDSEIDNIDYVFLDEKASDMEVYECNMESTYFDALEYDYWLSEHFTRTIDIFGYKTLYVECEDDANGWITCRVYYKDKIDWDSIN